MRSASLMPSRLATLDAWPALDRNRSQHGLKYQLRGEAWPRSEEIGLLHDPEELLLIHLPITIPVRLVNHLLKLLVGHPLTQLLRHALQVLERDLTRLVVVEEAECLEDLVFGVAIQNLVRHHFQELLVFNGATPIVVDVRNHLLDLLLLGLKAQSTHRDFQLLRVNRSASIRIEQIESLFDFLFLFVGELLLLLAPSVEPTKRHGGSRNDSR